MTVKATDEWTRAETDAARAILLEPSPYAVDGGELIGRDPRKIPVEEFNAAGIDGAPILAVLRAKCLDCVSQQPDEVRKCVAVACPNWPYRMGANPFRAARELTEEQRERSAEALARARAASQKASPVILDSNSASPKFGDASAGAGMTPEDETAIPGSNPPMNAARREDEDAPGA